MGKDIYTGFWEGKLPEIIEHIEQGLYDFEIDIQAIKALSSRRFESTNYSIKCGELLDDKNIHAYNRDFAQVILKSDYYQNHLFEKEISVSTFKNQEAKLLFNVSSGEIEQVYFDVISDKNPGEEVVEAYKFLLNCLKNHPDFAIKLTEKKSIPDELNTDIKNGEKNPKVSLKLERISSKYDTLFKMNRPFSFTVNDKFLSFFIRDKASYFKPQILKERFKGKPNSANEYKIRLYNKADAKSLFEYISNVLEKTSEEALKENELKLKLLDDYKLIIKAKGFVKEKYKWELLQKQKGHPNISAINFTEEVNQLKLNNLSYRFSLPAIKEIAESYPDELRESFIELQNVSDNLSERIISFKKDADELFSRIKEGKKPFQDERVIAAYLTMIKPDDYTLYKDTYYQSYCKLVGIKPKSANYKYEHYLNLIKDLAYNYYPVDSELRNLEEENLGELIKADPNHMLLMQDMLYRSFDQDNIKGEESKTMSDLETIESKNMISLNQILYGPPGTGKTYHTINKALEIIDPEFLAVNQGDRTKLTARYDELVDSGQIVFTTFHQSMTYEDFVEGIKPETKDDKVIYNIQNGLFKLVCLDAEKNYYQSKVNDSNNDVVKTASFESAFDLLQAKIQEAIFKQQEAAEINVIKKNKIQVASDEIKEGLVLNTPHSFFSITGVVSSSIKMMTRTGDKRNTMTKATLKKIYENPESINDFLKGGMKTYYKALVDEMLLWKEEIKNETRSISLQNYVLIIDEINRGNISQIFGELITLIEKDKRIGKSESLKAQLPYSKEMFGVPSNLYVIGTMNTADRSVEALDSALRRRFDFIEMPPKPKIFETERLDKGIVEGIDLQELLRIINERIEQLLDNDHLIGHSYFMGVTGLNDLKHCFHQNIIPLLQEYFFGDYGKIGLVLGKGFVSKKEVSHSSELFADFDYDSTSLNERPIYKIMNQSLMSDEEFSDSIKKLIGKGK